MVWLVAGLPLAAVIGSIMLIIAAVRSGGADVVVDPVSRTGQIQTVDLAPDANAATRGLSAVVQIGDGSVHVYPASGDFERGRAVRLRLLHPGAADRDMDLRLQADSLGWKGRAPVDAGHAWNLVLESSAGDWRLEGRLAQGERAARLAPKVMSP